MKRTDAATASREAIHATWGTADSNLRVLVDQLTQSNQAYRERVGELQVAADGLRQEVEAAARRLRMVMGQLASAEERAGNGALARAIRSIAADQSNLSFDAAWSMLGERASEGSRRLAAGLRLGQREREVLRLLTEGNRSLCIAERLGISIATVEVHRRNIMRKLDLHSVAELTKYAVREGLTSL